MQDSWMRKGTLSDMIGPIEHNAVTLLSSLVQIAALKKKKKKKKKKKDKNFTKYIK